MDLKAVFLIDSFPSPLFAIRMPLRCCAANFQDRPCRFDAQVFEERASADP